MKKILNESYRKWKVILITEIEYNYELIKVDHEVTVVFICPPMLISI